MGYIYFVTELQIRFTTQKRPFIIQLCYEKYNELNEENIKVEESERFIKVNMNDSYLFIYGERKFINLDYETEYKSFIEKKIQSLDEKWDNIYSVKIVKHIFRPFNIDTAT